MTSFLRVFDRPDPTLLFTILTSNEDWRPVEAGRRSKVPRAASADSLLCCAQGQLQGRPDLHLWPDDACLPYALHTFRRISYFLKLKILVVQNTKTTSWRLAIIDRKSNISSPQGIEKMASSFCLLHHLSHFEHITLFASTVRSYFHHTYIIITQHYTIVTEPGIRHAMLNLPFLWLLPWLLLVVIRTTSLSST